MFMGGQSKHNDFVIAHAPPPPAVFLISLYLPFLPHHCPPPPPGLPWLVDCYYYGGWRGECAFYCNHWVAGWLPGRKLCVHVSFFNKTAPAARKATNRDCQGMLKVIQHALMVAKL
jgi:hypothetical protein